MSGEHGLSPSRVVLLSVLAAAGTSALTTLTLWAVLGGSDGRPGGRSGRRDTTATPVGERSVGRGLPSDTRKIGELEDSVARIERALEEEGVPLDPAAARKDEVLAKLLAITQAERQLAVREAFQELWKCGDAAVPDIVALLKSGRDQDYGGGFSFGGNMFTGGYPRLRTVLIDALRQIGTPAAKEGLLDALRDSDDLYDYRDLLLLYGSTADEQMVKGISAMVPAMLAKMREGGEGADRLDRYVSGWIGKHGTAGTDDLLEDLAREALQEGKPDRGAFAALIDSAPDRAFALVSQQAGDAPKALRQVVMSIRMSRTGVSLANVARFTELVLAKMDPDETTRMSLYMSVPTRLDRSIKEPAERAADGRVLLELLERQLRTEEGTAARRALDRTVERLRTAIASCEKR